MQLLSTPVVVAECVIALIIAVLSLIQLRRRRSVRRWCGGLALFLIGGIVGGTFGTSVRVPIDDDTTFVGFPVPGIVLRLESGHWVDYVGGAWCLLDIPLYACDFLLPLLLILLVTSKGRPPGGSPNG